MEPRASDAAQLNSLHVAASIGHADRVERLLNQCAKFAYDKDEYGYSPLHYACLKRNVSVTKLLVSFDPNLARKFDNNGHTPLHLAAINGDLAILEKILASARESFQELTKYGKTVFHLAARFNNHTAYNYLAKVFRDEYLLHQPDRSGNTSLHIAISRGHYNLAESIIRETKAEINYQNYAGHTALDILNQARSTSVVEHLKVQMKKLGGKTSIELRDPVVHRFIDKHEEIMLQEFGSPQHEHEEPLDHGVDNEPTQQLHRLKKRRRSRTSSFRYYNEMQPEAQDNNVSEPKSSRTNSFGYLNEMQPEAQDNNVSSSSSRPKMSGSKHSRSRGRKPKSRIDKDQSKLEEVYMEALQNVRNVITLVAILIATVTFTAGISPPGGVYQEGPMKGKSIAARTTAFKVFTVSNNIALFTSLCIVTILVSIIPFQRESLRMLIKISHKAMWVAEAFMVTAYVAASWVTMPHHGNKWTFWVLVAVCGGTLGSVFIYLKVTLVRHWLRKSKLTKEAGNTTVNYSDNSDVLSSDSGSHPV